MDIWIVFENVDHGCEKHMTTHLTRKGAYIEAWVCLLSSFEGLEDIVNDGWLREEHNKGLSDFVDKTLEIWRGTESGCDPSKNPDWGNIKLEELEQHFSDFQLAVHEPLDWAKEVSIHKTTAQA